MTRGAHASSLLGALADMVTNDEVAYRPENEQLRLLYREKPRIVVDVLSEALSRAAGRPACNVDKICRLVGETFDRAKYILFPDAKSGRDVSMQRWFKQVHAICTGVLRSLAAPLTGVDGVRANHLRAKLAACFCMSLFPHAVNGQPTRQSDMLWRLLATSVPSVSTVSKLSRHRVSWFSAIVRIAVSMTPAGMWREANIAIRAKPGIAMEILRQLPTLSTEHAQIVDAEMGVGANAPEADAALEADAFGTDALDSFIDDADFTDETDEFERHLGGVHVQPTDEVAAKPLVAYPPTPPTPTPTPPASTPAHRGSFTCSLNGHFRVVKRGSELVAETPNTQHKTKIKQRRVSNITANAARALQFSTTNMLWCPESSAALLEQTRDWAPRPLYRVDINSLCHPPQ